MHTKHIASLALLAAGAAATTAAMRPAAPAADSITGTVTYTGTLPKMKPIDMAKEPTCAADHKTPVTTESAVGGPNNSLEDVVIYISAGDKPSAPSTHAVRYDQRGCQYVPHVAIVEVNQPIEISNLDKTSHNIHPLAKANAEWNKSQPPGAPPLKESFAKAEFIPVKCNIHPWMHGYFAVLNTSHATTSGEDGTFSLKGLPAGKYTVTAWHERFGTQSQEVTIGAGAPPKVNFVFKATPY
ncbi:MAG: carboxypeptidase regulatory-like domain-containing protein [bacterium]